MMNPDREELVKLRLFTPGELAVRLDEWANCLPKAQADLRSDMRCAAIHLRSLASSDSGVKVRELEWRLRSSAFCDEWKADTVVGRYDVGRVGDNFLAVRRAVSDGLSNDDVLIRGADENAAKAAAQADYEARVRSALVEVPAVKGEPVAWRYRCKDDAEFHAWAYIDRPPYGDWQAEALYTAPPADAGMRDALEDIEALGRHLRQGGPDPMDLQELSDALSDAVDFASGALLVAASQPAIVACCVTGAIPGDGGACGDCDPCLLGEASVPSPVKRLIAEKNSLLHRIGELEDKLDVALTAPGATTKSDGLCFCYFSCTDAPNCRRKAALESDVEALAATTAERPGTVTSEPEPSTSDPSSTRSEVTVDELADFIDGLDVLSIAVHSDDDGAATFARALLDQFEIRRKKPAGYTQYSGYRP